MSQLLEGGQSGAMWVRVSKRTGHIAPFMVLWLAPAACIPPPPAAESAPDVVGTSDGQGGSEASSRGTGMLIGAVQSIDGHRAPNTSKPIALASGCHIIRTRQTQIMLLHFELEMRAWVTPVEIHVPVSPGNKYVIEYKWADSSASWSTVITQVREEDASGHVLAVFPARRITAKPDSKCFPLVMTPDSK